MPGVELTQRSKLYNNLLESGKVGISDIGTEDTFTQNLSSPEIAKQVYGKLSAIFSPEEIGDENQFIEYLSPDFKQEGRFGSKDPFEYKPDPNSLGPIKQNIELKPIPTKERTGYLDNVARGFVSSGITALTDIGRAKEDLSQKAYTALSNISSNPYWRGFWDIKKAMSAKSAKEIEESAESAPELTGKPGEQLGSLLPYIGLAAVSIIFPPLAPASTAAFTGMGYGGGVKAYDDQIQLSGEQPDDLKRTFAGLGYAAAYSVPVTGLVGKMIPKQLIGKALQATMRSNPEIATKLGREIFINFAQKNSGLANKLINNTAKLATTTAKGAASGAATMEAINLSKRAVDAYIIDKELDPFWNTVKESAVSGAMFGVALAPFAVYSQNAANAARREAQGSVTIAMKNGKPVEVIPNSPIAKENQTIAMTPQGRVVKLTSEEAKNSFTMPLKEFNEAMDMFANTKEVSQSFERDMYVGRMRDVLNKISDTNGNIQVPVDTNTDILAVVGSKNGKHQVVTKSGEMKEVEKMPTTIVNKGEVLSTLSQRFDEATTPKQPEQIFPEIGTGPVNNTSTIENEIGEFRNKQNPSTVKIAKDQDGNKFYVIDELPQTDGNPLFVIKSVNGGELSTGKASEFEISEFPESEYIDNYIKAKEELITQAEQSISDQIDNSPVPVDPEVGEIYEYNGKPVTVVDITEDAVFVQDQDGNIHDVQPSDLMDDLPMPADGTTTEVITPIEQEQKQQQKADLERRRQELESSREIETLYDFTNPIAEDSKEIISKIEEANKLRKDAQEKFEEAVKETNEEIRIDLNSDAIKLNEKAQILDKEVKKSRDIIINNTPIKQAIESTWSIGQKLLNKIKLAAKSNEWVSSMPISKEEFTKLEDAIKRLSVKKMGEVTSNSEVIPDILLIEEINAKYDTELKSLNNQITQQQKQQAQQQEQIQEQIPLTKDGKPDYDNMPPQMLVEQLRANGFDETEITGLVSNVVTNLEKQRSLIDKKAVKSINEAVERKSKLKVIDSKINGLKAIIEPTPQEQQQKPKAPIEKPLTFKQELNSLGEPMSRFEYIADMIARGTKIKMNDTKGSKGFAAHMGLKPGSKEVRMYIGIRNEKEGMTPEQLAHYIYETDQTGLFAGLDTMEILDYVLDVLRYTNSRRKALEYIKETRQDIEPTEPDGLTEEELNEIIWQHYEDELLNLSPEEAREIDEYLVNTQLYEDYINSFEDLPDDNESRANIKSTEAYNQADEGISQEGDAISPERGNNNQGEDGAIQDQGTKSSPLRYSNELVQSEQNLTPQQQEQVSLANAGAIFNQEIVAKQAEIQEAEAQVNTEPTQAQKEAGNYKKGHITIQGLDVTIENPKGSIRSGIDSDGETWSQEMKNTYGYILGTTGKDADHIDVFLGENPLSDKVFVIDQINKDKSFDEHKVMLGFDDIEEAKAAYLSNYETGWQGLGNITETTIDKFNDWAKAEGKRIKPFAEYKEVINSLFDNPNNPKLPDGYSFGKTELTGFNSDRFMTEVLKNGENSFIYKITPTRNKSKYRYIAYLEESNMDKAEQAGYSVDEDDSGYFIRFDNIDDAVKFSKEFGYEKYLDEQKNIAEKTQESSNKVKNKVLNSNDFNNIKDGKSQEINPAIQTQNELREQGVPYRRNKNIRHDPGQSSLWEKSGYNPSINNRVVFAESHLSEIGQINFLGNINGPAKITGANDIAYLFRNLESASSENVFAVFIDKNKEHTVQYVSTGGPTSSVLDPRVIVSAAQRLNAESVYLVHNHPSGNLNASGADISRTGELKEALGHIGKELAGSIIINLDSGKYSEIDIQSQQTNVHEKLPISGKIIEPKIFAFDRQVLYIPSSERTQINSSGKAAEFLSKQKRGIVPKIHIIYANNALEVTAYEFHDETVETNEIIKKIIGNADGINTTFILASNTNIPGKELKKIIDATKSINLKLLDYIEIQQDSDIINNYKSYADNGILSEEKPLYGKSILSEPNNSDSFTSESLPDKIIIDGVERSTKNNLGEPIAQTEEGIRNFWKWFGDSKVVDENGNPQIVYHGSRNGDFNSFDPTKGNPVLSGGMYFSDSKELSNKFAGPNGSIYSVYLKIENPSYGYFEGNGAEMSYSEYRDGGIFSKKTTDNYANKGDKEYIVFSSNQIKSATNNNGEFSIENNDIRFRASYFYSPTEQALNAIKQDKGTVEQFKAMLLKNGAKQSEMDWMQFDDSFPDAKKTITKADIQNWIDQNKIEAQEVVKGDNNKQLRNAEPDELAEYDSDWEVGEWAENNMPEAIDEDGYPNYKMISDSGKWFSDGNGHLSTNRDRLIDTSYGTESDTKFSQYVEPGGKNYKELLLTMPSFNDNLSEDEYWEFRKIDEKPYYDRTPEEQTKLVQYQNRFAESRRTDKDFKSSHFDEPNILAHVRFDERTSSDGKKVLFIEEIQSDWAQKGKKEGFGIKKKQKTTAQINLDNYTESLNEKYGNEWDSETITEEDYSELTRLNDLANESANFDMDKTTGVPDMPFKKTDQWVNLALRRMMMYAADNGFDRIAWTTGEQQAERYDLSKQVSMVRISRNTDTGNYDIGYKQSAHERISTLKESVPANELDQYIGKELAQKALNDLDIKQIEEDNPFSEKSVDYEGNDLKVGGEGMKAFYDNIVPNAANKLGKPFGVNVESIEIDNIGKQQSIPITDKIKEQAEIGMPLYKQGPVISENIPVSLKAEVESIAKSINTPVTVIEDVNKIPSSQVRARKSKGWYNPKTGEIVVVLPNHTGIADIQATILHEAVAHKGLRGLLGSQFRPMMQAIFDSMSENSKVTYLARYGDPVTAAEEYCASMAEKDIPPTLLEKIISVIRNFFRKIGIKLQMSAKDIEFMLWRSKNRLKAEKIATVKERIEDMVRADKMKEQLRFRERPETNDITLSWAERKIEIWQDRMVSVKKLIDILGERGGKVPTSANPYIVENLSTSKQKAKIDIFINDIYKPLMDKVISLEKDYGVQYKDITRYAMAKHAKERNKTITSNEVYYKVSRKVKSEELSTALEKYPSMIRSEVERMYSQIFEGRTPQSPQYSDLTDIQLMELNRLRKAISKEFTTILESEITNNRSGYTDQEADKITSEFENIVPKDKIDEMWNMIRRTTGFTLDTWLETGLISREHYKSLTQTNPYKYYVPLRGWEEREDIDYVGKFSGDYMGSSILNMNRAAQGRTSVADDPFPIMASMAESAVISGGKNEIRRAAWRMAVANKDMTDLFSIKNSWYVNLAEDGNDPYWVEVFDKPAQKLFDEGKAKKMIDKSYDWHKTNAEIDLHTVPVFIDGEKMLIEFKGNFGVDVATAINHMNTSNFGSFFRDASNINRWIASNLTSKNPDFMLTNFTRDYMFGNISYFVKGGDIMALNSNIKSAFTAIHNDRFDKNKDSALQKMYLDFKLNGGQTGYIHLAGVESYKKDIERLRLHASGVYSLGDRVLRNAVMRTLGNSLEYMALMSENAMRFAVYKTEIERMMKDAGVAEPTNEMKVLAAQAAKDITVNFNRRGSYNSRLSTFFGSLFAFFNASMQGNTTFLKLSKENPKKFAFAMSTLIGLSFLAAYFSSLFSGGDDDENEYDKLSDYVKSNNLIILNPFSSGKDEFITIPTPHGFRAFASIGPIAVDVMRGKKDAIAALGDLSANIVTELSPISLSGFDLSRPNSSVGIISYLTPTLLRPPMEAFATNQDYMGNPITKKPFLQSMEGITPQWQLVPKGTNKILVGGSRLLNNLAGGTDNISSYVPKEVGRTKSNWYGFITDINPAKIEHLFEGYLGGRMRFWNDVYKTANSIANGETPAKQNIPVFRRFYQEPKERGGWAAFYDTRDYVQQIDARMKDYKESNNIEGQISLNNFYNAKIISIYKTYEKPILDLSSKINDKVYKGVKTDLEKQRDLLLFDLGREVNKLNKMIK